MFLKKHIASSFLLIIVFITSFNYAQTTDLILHDTTIVSTVIFEAANSITAESNFVVTADGGNVTFKSGGTVTINPIFTIHTGGIFQVFTDAVVKIEEEIVAIPEKYFLNQNYPNPFNPSTKISYTLPTESNIEIEISNMLGQSVEILVNGNKPAGYYETTWNAENLSSGTYLIRLRATGVNSNKNFTQVQKALLIK